jgi:phenylpyruvate tautomerase PptA (4-oxalocrotonate tautomerase family)
MPLYVCSLPPDALDDRKRQRIADAITRIHCDLTAAPATFVHVVFRDSESEQYMVLGTIRAGRSDDTKGAIKQQMAEAVAEIVRADAGNVLVFVRDVPASWVMEGGAIMPEPGEEDDWLAAHAAPSVRNT